MMPKKLASATCVWMYSGIWIDHFGHDGNMGIFGRAAAGDGAKLATPSYGPIRDERVIGNCQTATGDVLAIAGQTRGWAR